MDFDVKIVVARPSDYQPHWRAKITLIGGPHEFKNARYACSRDAAIRGCQVAVLRTLAEWLAVGEVPEPLNAVTFNVVDD